MCEGARTRARWRDVSRQFFFVLAVWWCVPADHVLVLVRRWAFTGTLDPVRNLTGLNMLNLDRNYVCGTFVRTAFGIAALGAVLAS